MSILQLLTLLRKIEWQGDETHFVCPCCRRSRQHGHAHDCELWKQIADAEEAA